MTSFQLNLMAESVGDLNPEEPLCVDETLLTSEVINQLKQRRVGVALVTRGGRMAGIFTERDAMRLLANRDDLNKPISQYMKTSVVWLKREDKVATAITKMSQGGFRRLPIVDQNGSPTKMISVAGILRYLVEHFPEAIYNQSPSDSESIEEREGA